MSQENNFANQIPPNELKETTPEELEALGDSITEIFRKMKDKAYGRMLSNTVVEKILGHAKNHDLQAAERVVWQYRIGDTIKGEGEEKIDPASFKKILELIRTYIEGHKRSIAHAEPIVETPVEEESIDLGSLKGFSFELNGLTFTVDKYDPTSKQINIRNSTGSYLTYQIEDIKPGREGGYIFNLKSGNRRLNFTYDPNAPAKPISQKEEHDGLELFDNETNTTFNFDTDVSYVDSKKGVWTVSETSTKGDFTTIRLKGAAGGMRIITIGPNASTFTVTKNGIQITGDGTRETYSIPKSRSREAVSPFVQTETSPSIAEGKKPTGYYYLEGLDYPTDELDSMSENQLHNQAVIEYSYKYLKEKGYPHDYLNRLRDAHGAQGIVTEANNALIREENGEAITPPSEALALIPNSDVIDHETILTESEQQAFEQLQKNSSQENSATTSAIHTLVEKVAVQERNLEIEQAAQGLSNMLFGKNGDKPENIRYATLALEKHPDLADESDEDTIWNKVQMVIMREELMNSL